MERIQKKADGPTKYKGDGQWIVSLVGRHTLPALLPPQTSAPRVWAPRARSKTKKPKARNYTNQGFGKLVTLVLFLRM